MTLVVAAFLLWPRVEDPGVEQARENGYRAARSAIYHRQLAAVALDSLVAAKYKTDAVIRLANRRISAVNTAAMTFDSLPTRVDSQPRVIVGPVAEHDSLVSLTLARMRVQMIVDTANAAIASIEMAIELERGRASLAILNLQATIAAQDTVILSLRSQIAAKSPPWYKRGAKGVQHAGAAGACGAAGWILGGPLIGAGSAATCAFLSAVLK